jgi:hypothetical protein
MTTTKKDFYGASVKKVLEGFTDTTETSAGGLNIKKMPHFLY